MKTLTQNLYQLTKTMSQDTKEMKSHLLQSLPQSKLQNILTAASQLSTFQQTYPNIHSELQDLLNNFENNPNSTLFSNIKEFLNSLDPELVNKIEDLTTTLKNTLTPQFISKVNYVLSTIINSFTPQFMIKINHMVEAITNF